MRKDRTAPSPLPSSAVRTLPLVVGLVTVLLPAIASSAEDELRRVQAEAGKVWYDKYCTPCHGEGGAPGTAMGSRSGKPVDLRTYVAHHGGKFPVADWVNLIATSPPGSVHAAVWQKLRESQQETAATSAASRGMVAAVATYVASVQAK